jgi:hypothetical protein
MPELNGRSAPDPHPALIPEPRKGSAQAASTKKNEMAMMR